MINPIAFTSPSWDAIHESLPGVYLEHESLYAALSGFYGKLMAMDHVFLSCMATTEFGLEIAQRTPLRCAGKQGVWLFSGSLADWKRACLEICVPETDNELRKMFNKIVLLFDTQRIFAFGNYNRKRLNDSFVMEEKK